MVRRISRQLHAQARQLLLGDARTLVEMMTSAPRVARCCVGIIVVGCAAYGYGVGLWRGTQLATYVAIKLPLVVLLTLVATALANGLAAILLNTGLGLRTSVRAQLMCFAIAALLLGGLSPLAVALAVDAPAHDSARAASSYAAYMLVHTLIIGFAGVTSHLHLWRLLVQICPTRTKARITLALWIGGNAAFGMQLSWVLRPFFGHPATEVQFVRDAAFAGTFVEAILSSLERLSSFPASIPVVLLGVAIGLLVCFCRLTRWLLTPPTKIYHDRTR